MGGWVGCRGVGCSFGELVKNETFVFALLDNENKKELFFFFGLKIQKENGGRVEWPRGTTRFPCCSFTEFSMGFYLVFPGCCTELIFNVLPSFQQSVIDLPSFTGFYLVSSVFTGFYLVSSVFTGFYWVLPSFQ